MLWQSARRARKLGLVALVALVSAGCSTSAKEVREARRSGYMTDFAVVYGAALAATKKLYPNLAESATRQLIVTAWHPLRLVTGTVDDSQTNLNAGTNTNRGNIAQGTRYFVRFRVYVLGGKPFRIRIEGEASSWTAGEVPSPLKGAEVPPWLGARTDALRVAIHRRLKEHAVPLEVRKEISRKPKPTPLPDAKGFGEVPEAAGKLIARVSHAADARDAQAMRELVADDVVWAPNSQGADAALAIWAADGSLLEGMSGALAAGCAETNSEVVCPKQAASGGFQGFVARFKLTAAGWKLVSFFKE